jgi:hypothetical protein
LTGENLREGEILLSVFQGEIERLRLSNKNKSLSLRERARVRVINISTGPREYHMIAT